jgi:hypothetical protein
MKFAPQLFLKCARVELAGIDMSLEMKGEELAKGGESSPGTRPGTGTNACPLRCIKAAGQGGRGRD